MPPPPPTPERGKAPSPEEATAEVGHALNKLLNAHRFYAEGHASLVEFQGKLWEAVRQYHAVVGPLVLHVRSTTLSLGSTVLIEAQSVRDSSTRALFLEGVQQIVLQPGLEQEDLSAFVSLWNRALQRALPPEYDFYTLFWERGFEDIELVVAEVPAAVEANSQEAKDEALLAEREDKLFVELTRKQVGGGSRKRPVGHDEWLSRLEAEVLAPVSDEDLERTTGFAGVSDAELAELKAALARPAENLLERSLMAVWAMLGVCREEERPVLLGWAEELLTGLVAQGQWVELKRAVQLMVRDARTTGTRTSDLYATTRLLLKEQARFALATAAARPGELPRVVELLDALPRDALQACPELLFETASLEARAAFAKLLARRAVPLTSLVARAAELKEADLGWLQPLREQLADPQPLLGALLAHPAPGMRAAILNKLSAKEVEAQRPVLLRALADVAPQVRQAALTVLVRQRVEAAVGPLVNRLQSPLEAAERKSILRALAELGGPIAAAALRSSFEREEDTDLKAHCARCIGLLGDPRARPLLQAVAQKLFAPKALREACKEALAQLAPVN
jgi:hypothetical protein